MTDINSILGTYRNIAVVGLSDKRSRPSNQVALYMQREGYTIIPVNPRLDTVLGEKCYPDLSTAAKEHTIEIVDIFRRSEHVLPVVKEAIRVGAKVIWMQLGVVDAEAGRIATEAGLQVLMDRCIKIEHLRLQA